MPKKEKKKIKKEAAKIRDEIRVQTASYLLAAFGLVAGLAWNDAITALIKTLFPPGSETIIAQFVYAIAITIFVVIISVAITRILKKKNKD